MLSAINAGNTGTNRPHQAGISTAGRYTFAGRVIRRRTLPHFGGVFGVQANSKNRITTALRMRAPTSPPAAKRMSFGDFDIPTRPWNQEKPHQVRLSNFIGDNSWMPEINPALRLTPRRLFTRA